MTFSFVNADFKPIEVEPVNDNGVRYYPIPGADKYYPSVTSIISQTKSQKDIEALNNWKKDVGFDVAAKVSKESSDRGTEMHGWIESILLLRANGELLDEVNLPKKMAETIIENGIKNKVSEVLLTLELLKLNESCYFDKNGKICNKNGIFYIFCLLVII